MRLKKVTLNNFRCFEHLELDLHPRLTVLVGTNGSGKTAILDGIAFGLAPVLSHLSSANQRLSVPVKKDTDLRIIQKAGRGGKLNWVTSDFNQVIVETTTGLRWDRFQTSKNVKHTGSKIGQGRLAEYISQVYAGLQSDSQELLPVIACYGARRGWVAVPGRLRESKVNYSFPVSALVGALDSLTDFKEMLKWFDQEEASELRANKGTTREDWQESSLLNAVRATISAILLGEFHNPHFNTKHQFVVESKKNPGQLLQVSQLSQGYQSMLALAMDFARRLALANDHLEQAQAIPPSLLQYQNYLHPAALTAQASSSFALWAPAIMLVDEIDLHLHPSWQQRVLDDLMRAFPLTQFIVTTHSPQVLTTVHSECIRILQDGHISSAPPGTEGAEASRILKRVLGVDVRPPDNEATKELQEYLALVDADQWNSQRALEMRKKLDARYKGEEPALLDADLRIENRKWELGE
jgi:predicted ATP-binding protein involved in virulence